MSRAHDRGHDNGSGPKRARARKRPAEVLNAPAEPDAESRRASARVLLVASNSTLSSVAGPVLGSMDAAVEAVDSVDGARARLGDDDRPAVDIVVIDERAPEALDLLREAAQAEPAVVPVLASTKPTLDLAVEAMRSGAVDLMKLGRTDDAVHAARASLALAIDRANVARHREGRVERLRTVCRQLNSARQDISSQISGMCNDLVEAYQELSDQMDQLTISGEFNGIIRQELEIESLLRTALEFILAKIGPTNAAVFLPSNSNDFSLGAYVNCDFNAAALDTLLDHLGDSLAPRFERRSGVHVYPTRADTAQMLGDDAHWLPEHASIVFPCHREDECLAVVALFRDDRTPFEPGTQAMLETIGKLFSAQLARIIHVHHRHLPKSQWGAPGDEPDEQWDDYDDLDLAA
jgi:FixJ family two-component response regulator